jgi:hypothetical protein
MPRDPRYPSLYQINTRIWLRQLSRTAGKPITLADIDDETIDLFAEQGFDWIWLLSVWRTGFAGRAISRGNRQWREEFKSVIPDLTEDDICGSGFAITSYTVSEALGGETALAAFRDKLTRRGLKLMLDFVPNHTAPDHPWVKAHPEYYVEGNEKGFAAAPQNYLRVDTDEGPKILAYGRDPNYPGWPDTLQLNYGNPALQAVRIAELLSVAGKCDGVRCDMAMLLLPEVFQRTWGIWPEDFWPKAIATVRARHPGFKFLGEVYWDLEWTLQQQGFDYCYDKRLYDRLKAGNARAVREHLLADLAYQDRLARFLENHDEPRAAHEFPLPQHCAAAIITFLSPGLRFFHQGQLEGARVRVPVHLCRSPVERVDRNVSDFYARLLSGLLKTRVLSDGAWSMIEPQPAWHGNWSSEGFIASAWSGADGRRVVAVVNYTQGQSQCRLRLPFIDLRGKQVRLTDLMGTERYDRDGSDIVDQGLFIDLAPWRFNVFELHAT